MFQAVIMGSRFASLCSEGACGKVHSVFDRAVNIEIAEQSADVSLLTVLCAGSDVMPASLVTTMHKDSWNNYCTIGNNVIFTKDAVYLNSVPLISRLSAAEVWKPASDETINNLPKRTCEELAAQNERIKLYLKENRIPANTFMVGSLDNLDVTALLGWGVGLTPSGDDFLAGLLYAMYFTQMVYNRKLDILPTILSSVLQNMAGKTNQISRHFLRYAAEGLWGRATERFMLAVHGNDNAALYDAIREKAVYGATSGTDEIQGIMFGFYEVARLFGEGRSCI
ncbi:MAG: hypothetical protein BWY11_01567 [Firmicutes bacterium ADurb.Bin182]|nr:MAG: hypothetical protein BWY11_01567 [Firmicutes bacterium ADurb.Bin182]